MCWHFGYHAKNLGWLVYIQSAIIKLSLVCTPLFPPFEAISLDYIKSQVNFVA